MFVKFCTTECPANASNTTQILCSIVLSSGVVNWDAFSEEHRRTYRTPYRISFIAILYTKTVKATGDVDRGENYRDSTPTMNLQDTAVLTAFMRLEALCNN